MTACPLKSQDTGSEPFSPMTCVETWRSRLSGSAASESNVQRPADYTGNCSQLSEEEYASGMLNGYVVTDTGSPHGKLHLTLGLRLPSPTSGRKKLLSLALDSNSEPSHSSEMIREIGKKCGRRLKRANWERFQPTYVFGIIGLSKPLLATIRSLLQLSELFMFSGDELELEKGTFFLILVSEHGKRQVWMLTVKIRDPSGGTDTAVRQLLLSVISN